MAKVFKIFQHGIRLPDITDALGCCADPSLGACLCACHEGKMYVLTGVLKTYLAGSTRDIVSTDQTQTLTNKTLCSPILNCVTFGGSSIFEDDEILIVDTTDNTKK